LGEIEKGRIKKGMVFLCESCNNRIKILELNIKSRNEPDGMPDFFREIFEGKK